MPSSVLTLLSHYRHPQWPAEYSPQPTDWQINESEAALQVQLTLPFAAQSQAEHLQAFLTEQTGIAQVEVALHCRLPGKPVFEKLKHIVLVASGKGGVGKSTTAVNLALALGLEGAKVGLLDADVYGPSIPLMVGMQGERPTSHDGKIMEPLGKYGAKVNSIGFLMNPEDAAIWRGPMASSALTQLVSETNWGELDYLVVDMPPGTGDIQLTIAQKFPCTGAVVVTTPQNIALADAEKGITLFNKVDIPVLGVIENMSYYQCSACGNVEHIFGREGAIAMAEQHGTTLLGQIPLETANRENGDKGTPTVMQGGPVAQIYRDMAQKLSIRLYELHQAKAGNQIDITLID